MGNLSLYQMSQEWEQVFEMLCDPDVPEDAIFDTIAMIEADMDTKAESYAKLIQCMDADATAISAEVDRLSQRKRSISNRVKSLKRNLEDMMRTTGRRKFKTPLFSFSIQKNGGACPVELAPGAEIPAEWRKPGDPDTVRIRQYLEQGNSLPFAQLGERGESLRIR